MNVALIPVLAITLRNNIYFVIFNKMPKSVGFDLSKIISTLIITFPLYFFALFLQ